MDLVDLDSMRAFAAGMHADGVGVDVLVNNAGVMVAPRRLSCSGWNSTAGCAPRGVRCAACWPIPGSRPLALPAKPTTSTCARSAPHRPPTAPVSPTACAHSPPRASTPYSTSPAPAPCPTSSRSHRILATSSRSPTSPPTSTVPGFSTAPDHATPEALVEAAALGAAGAYVPHVEVTYPLDQIGAAHARAESGHARGKLVITF